MIPRFWHSSAAYALAQAVQNDPENCTLPSNGDVIYRWPEDILKPNISLLLNVDEHERIKRHNKRNTTNTAEEKLLKNDGQFRQNVVKAYKNMYDPPVEIIDANPSTEEILEDIYHKIKHLL
ncbi:UMP-CMP kinase 2, mitochondrial-like isoform X2 [Agrilus planipennis]|uniref:UMP-CMP kinase 2, mitochondrial-like isoform X2 n=1 Tax=Agrilus planipennis TaxID=224129 RepID=A0A7F5R2D2_AGRPL|nr:UMP-CMP kinase 2, mitochondrial-like isoform X2 [Agrilus planipennis]